LEWNRIPAASEYIVERSVDDRPWLVHTITLDTALVDSGLPFETWHAYRVRPVGQDESASASVAGLPGRFPGSYAEIAGVCSTDGNAYGVAVSGSYAYLADHGNGLQVIRLYEEPN